MEKKEIVVSNFPQLSPTRKRRTLAGVRPFRKGGIRLEKQPIQGKIVVHNYGHGGAGVSLAPATAEQAAQMALKQCQPGEQMCVMGCGIVGLMSALECARQGTKVTIVADRIPQPATSNESTLTSQVAPGYWLPYHYEFPDQKQHDIRSQKSYNFYLQWIAKSNSLRRVPVFQDMDINQIKQKAPPFVAQTCRPVSVSIGKRKFNMVYFETIQINLQKFLQELIAECKQLNVKFVTKNIRNIDDVVDLPCRIIINCTGLGSKTIFNDKKVYGVKGHLIELQNSTKIKGIFGFKHEGQPVKLYCFDDKILLGLTKEEVQDTKINHQLAEQLQKRACNFYDSLSLGLPQIKPKL